MLIALSQSPITAQQFFEWNEKLQKDEILVREIIDIDTNYMEDETTGPSAKQKNSGDAYLRMIPRTEMDIAVVGCAVNVTIENEKCVDARVALGAVAPTALLVEDASKALIGSNFDQESIEKAALACEAACNPIDDKRGTISYRKKVSKVLFKRALEKAIERAKEDK